MKKKITNVLIIVLVSIFSLAVGASAATTIASTSVSYGNTTVKAALDELINIANQCPDNALCSKVSVGDYVRMTPTETTFTIPATLTGHTNNQTINPSELNLWRVIDIKNDGTVEMVSEYTSTSKIYFSHAKGYLNFSGAVNLIANQYGNSKYTISARNMGYNGQTATITDTTNFKFPVTWTASTSNNNNEILGGGDAMYEKDANLVMNAIGTLASNNPSGIATDYWLSSRYYKYKSSTSFDICVISVTGNSIKELTLHMYQSGGNGGGPYGHAIRPIVTLRSDITSYSGAGTSSSPWVLS